MAAEEDVLERGFQLAYFLVPDRPHAIRVLTEALNKLSSQRKLEKRRTYWRDKYLKRAITRISHQEADALQWLILFASERFEKEQESQSAQTLEELAIRYIKSLVRVTTAMSSFHVNVGVHRLLHNYSTVEVQRVYETVTDRYMGADEYRRAKSVLMTKLERRFGLLLRTCRTQYGELRFEAWDNQEPWQALAKKCLHLLTPWSTSERCPVPADFGVGNSSLPAELAPTRGMQFTPDQVETNRCHAFIDPECYGRLTRALDFDPPAQRLALPRFFMDKQHPDNTPDPPSPLSPDERKDVQERLQSESERRRDSSVKRIRVVVDGNEEIYWNLNFKNQCRVEIQEGAEIVEMFADEDVNGDKDLLIAAHRIEYSNVSGIAATRETVEFRNGKLLLNVTPGEPAAGDQPHRAVLNLSWEAKRALHLSGRPALWSLSKYAVASLACLVIGWIAGRYGVGNRPEARSQDPVNLVSSSRPPVTAGQPPVADESRKVISAYKAYTLVPDEEIVRGSGGPDFSLVVLSPDPGLLRFDLPLPPGNSEQSFVAILKPFQSNSVLLTEALTRNNSASSGRVVSLWVPSTLLRKDKDYAIELRSARAKSQGELSSYGFRTIVKGQ